MAVSGTALAYIAVAASVAGAATAAAGTVMQAEAAAEAAEANKAIAERQAQIARDQAVQERRRAIIQAEIFAREARRRQGVRVSQITASGISLSGSALDVLSDAALNDEQQRLLILHEGEERARARLAGASIEEMSAAEFARQASAERVAGGMRAGGTLISGFSQTGLSVSRSPALRRDLGMT